MKRERIFQGDTAKLRKADLQNFIKRIKKCDIPQLGMLKYNKQKNIFFYAQSIAFLKKICYNKKVIGKTDKEILAEKDQLI